MDSKLTILALTLLAAPVAARAEIIGETQGNIGAFQMTFGDHERCEADSLTIAALEATVQTVVTGPSQEALGMRRADQWEEALVIRLVSHDEDCQPVYDDIGRLGSDLEITNLDGSTVEILDCVDENGDDPTRSCEFDGLRISRNAFAVQGTYILPSGRTLTVDLTITKTNDTVMTGHVISTPVQTRQVVEFKSLGSVNDRVSFVEKFPSDILNEQFVVYSGSVSGSVLLDGQPLVADPGSFVELGTVIGHNNVTIP